MCSDSARVIAFTPLMQASVSGSRAAYSALRVAEPSAIRLFILFQMSFYTHCTAQSLGTLSWLKKLSPWGLVS